MSLSIETLALAKSFAKSIQTTIGGVGGAITLGQGLSITGNELSASGGGEQHLYWHSVSLVIEKDTTAGGQTYEYRLYCQLIILSTSATPIDRDALYSLVADQGATMNIIEGQWMLNGEIQTAPLSYFHRFSSGYSTVWDFYGGKYDAQFDKYLVQTQCRIQYISKNDMTVTDGTIHQIF